MLRLVLRESTDSRWEQTDSSCNSLSGIQVLTDLVSTVKIKG
jgi:hypothetical protein